MSINIGPPSVEELRPRITVIGVGGAGGNAIANMIQAEIEGVDFIVANTDAQALNNTICEHRIQLGPDITQGLGAGSRPEVGRAAAEETVEEIQRALEGVNMVFIAAGMGGGTGTGAAPVIAEAARNKGILTVGVVTKPFLFEGTRRMRSAESGIEELQKHVDTLIVIPNQNLFLVAKAETTFKEAFELADEVLQQGVRSITDLMVMPGLINLDFADVRSVMGEMGKAMMGTGQGEGESRALEAAERAIANPLLDGVSMQGAKGVIISIIGGEDMKLLEVDEAANHIRELVDPEANIIWGSAFNPDLQGKIRVSVVATGIEQNAEMVAQASQSYSMSSARGPKRPALSTPPAEERAPETPTPAPAPVAERTPARFESNDEQAAPAAPVHGGGASDALPDPSDDHGFGQRRGGYAAPADNSGEDQDDSDALELTLEDDEGQAPAAPSRGRQDELLLDASRLAEANEPVQPSISRRRSFLGGHEAEGREAERPVDRAASPAPARPAPSAPASGSTLFERMANLSRPPAADKGDAKDDDDGDSGPALRIPRFLGRQNNQ